MENWYSKLLSPAGKEVLSKAVVTALPSYCMSYFMLSLKLIKAIVAVTRRFWWSSQHDKSKVPWIAWDKMTNPKNLGGLGFRDLNDFNIALLAK